MTGLLILKLQDYNSRWSTFRKIRPVLWASSLQLSRSVLLCSSLESNVRRQCVRPRSAEGVVMAASTIESNLVNYETSPIQETRSWMLALPSRDSWIFYVALWENHCNPSNTARACDQMELSNFDIYQGKYQDDSFNRKSEYHEYWRCNSQGTKCGRPPDESDTYNPNSNSRVWKYKNYKT